MGEEQWVAELIDLYLSTSELFRGTTEEAAALALGKEKLAALHLRLVLRRAQWSDHAARLLFYNVLHLLSAYGTPVTQAAKKTSRSSSSSDKKNEAAGSKRRSSGVRASVASWCEYIKTVAEHVRDAETAQQMAVLADVLPGAVL